MQLNGQVQFRHPTAVIWSALHDPEILRAAIPGCESMTLNGEGSYDVVLRLGVAAIKGEYTGHVAVEDVVPQSHYLLTAEGSGTPGFVKVQMDCKLDPTEAGCRLTWDCSADVGGMIAGVGGRVLGGVAKLLAGQFFKQVEKQLAQVRA
ncbi:MAG: carbon monoxide dehydrogenase subunit G [Alicyclobacillus sp.]|nr:carbon monoxide dehydrogenase subunit G [Alicyclobacillus sp.]